MPPAGSRARAGASAADPDDTGAEDYGSDGREDRRRRLRGPADYDDIDLLRDARESGLNWLRTIPTQGYDGIPFRAGRELLRRSVAQR